MNQRKVRPRTSVGDSVVPHELRDRTEYMLCKLAEVSKRVTNETLAEFDIHSGHHAVLRALTAVGEISQQQLSARLVIDPSTVVALVDELESKHLATRQRSSTDRRVSLVSITEAGRSLLESMEPAVRELQRKLFARLSSRDYQRLHRLLLKLSGGETTESNDV